MNDIYLRLIEVLNSQADPIRAEHSQRFFKTGKGEYAEGDVFLGLTVPKQRIIASKFKDLPLNEIQKMLNSVIHEYRFVAIILIVNRFKLTKDTQERKKLINFYLDNTENINNWDLVDVSARILGEYLYDKDRKELYDLANSGNLWEQRIAIIATSYFIDKNEFADTIKISEILLNHKHDLIHKAVGWMLREVGKRDLNVLLEFLNKYYTVMPRTMLRYSIEKFPQELRLHYLKR
ncbi:DNA alkylation repair protein [Candidatus Dojkabacteria bacterium]|uniref:DNA alkylation repair protein n=1 Tax=Candidatus Dojkabacteria bacterium TaxID=2099670 RepID=A0A955IDK4_9BACT|nr:DNA alkylation repair protein [Candidatus Dojkabacteria bacterium]